MVRKGLPKSIIKKYGISKKAWRVFRGRKKSKTYKRKSSKSTRRKTTVTRRRSRRRSVFSTRTVFKFAKLMALFGPSVGAAMGGPTAGFPPPRNAASKVERIVALWSGYGYHSGRFFPKLLVANYAPYIMTSLVTTGIQKLNGIIRRL